MSGKNVNYVLGTPAVADLDTSCVQGFILPYICGVHVKARNVWKPGTNGTNPEDIQTAILIWPFLKNVCSLVSIDSNMC